MGKNSRNTDREDTAVDSENSKKRNSSVRSSSRKEMEAPSEKAGKLELEPASERMVHQILPYIYIVLAIFLFACFILTQFDSTRNLVGAVGWWVSSFFKGLISWSAFLLPPILVLLAINWRRYVDSKTTVSKTVFPVLFLITLPALIHVFLKYFGTLDTGFNIAELWKTGTDLHSGGVIGGLLAEVCYLGLNFVGSLIILFALTFMFFIFSIGMTPRNIWIFVRYKCKVHSERSAEKKEEKKEALKVKREEKLAEAKRKQKEKELLRREEEEKKRVAEAEENKRIEEAERRAAEIEESEKCDATLKADDAEVIKLAPESFDNSGALRQSGTIKPIMLNPIADAEDTSADTSEDMSKGTSEDVGSHDGKIELDKIFKDPPNAYSKAPRNPLADDASREASLEIEMKPITDIEKVPEYPDDGQPEEEESVPAYAEYRFPPVDLLKDTKNEEDEEAARKELMANAQSLMETLKSFNVRIQEINYSRGPTITRYELKPDVGVRIRSIANLVDDIALSLATTGVRIEAPIPNKPAVGVEVPNKHAAIVSLRSLIDTSEFAEKKSKLTSCLGKDVGGNPIFFDVGKMPHMLIAGTTGSGKSVCINCIIISLLYKASPNDLKLILIDPKKVEFNIYKNIPHLYAPIVSDPKKAAGALASAVAEMERRFELIEEVGARDIAGYNAITAEDPSKEHLPYMVIIIDELADLMMTAPDDVETAVCRIAQKARAAGIHLIVGTQRPSTDVITGLIKSNIPSRIAFAVASQVDSRTILDGAGAEKLIGRGDMLFSPIGVTKPLRVQGAFVSESEIERIVEFLKDNNDGAQFDDEFMRRMEEEAAKCGNKKGSGASGTTFDDGEPVEEGGDPKFKAAVDVAIEMGKISTSLLQRRLEIGYGRAAKIIDRMEALGYVSPPEGNKPRQVLVTKMEIMEKRVNDEIE